MLIKFYKEKITHHSEAEVQNSLKTYDSIEPKISIRRYFKTNPY